MSTQMPFIGILFSLLFLAAAVTSLFEKETRAALIFVLAGLVLPFPLLFPAFTFISYPDWLYPVFTFLPVLLMLILFMPFRGKIRHSRHPPLKRFDERDTMFSRRELVPGSERFEEYYRRNPQSKVPDNQFRKKPGLLKAGSVYHDPILFAAAGSMFEKVEELHTRVEGKPADQKTVLEPEAVSGTLIRMILAWGAHSAGITQLRDYNVYSAGGRGDRYGRSYEVEHGYAVAFTVEMDYDMMRAAPAAPAVVESARQYLQSGMIAVQVAEFIRSLGYPARAHIDGNYKVICPLVARDAGLGEIGRMGLLMTPRLGPRCRIAVVTTDLPLVTSRGNTGNCEGLLTGKGSLAGAWKHPGMNDPPDGTSPVPSKHDRAVIDFCSRCGKCALNCPGRSIPYGPQKMIDGVMRWRINSESCYTFWCQAGTDCGRCMIVCPYAHPDNWLHQLVRFGIRNNALFRRLALPLDDLFYGRKPRPRSV